MVNEDLYLAGHYIWSRIINDRVSRNLHAMPLKEEEAVKRNV
jgi:hypothetical protein